MFCTSNCPQFYRECALCKLCRDYFFGQIPNNNDELNSEIKPPLFKFGAIKYLRYTCELLNFNSFLNDVSNCNAIQSVNNTNGQKCSDLKYGEHM